MLNTTPPLTRAEVISVGYLMEMRSMTHTKEQRKVVIGNHRYSGLR